MSVAMLVVGCASETPPGPPATPGGATTPGDAVTPVQPATPTDVPPEVVERIGSQSEYCAGTGAPIVIPGSRTNATCTGALAERIFRYALCTCEGATTVASGFETRGFNSQGGQTSTAGAAVGVNTQFEQAGGLDIGGSLTVAGADGLRTIGSGIVVQGDLRTAGAYGFTGGSSVTRNAYVGGLSGVGRLTIGGDLFGASAGPFVSVAGAVDPNPVAVEAPCACGADDILDIDAIVADAAEQNHNLEAGLDPAEFSDLVGTVERELPCGRFYIDSIGGLGQLTLTVNGRTALFVAGDVESVGGLDVVLGPDGELDLFVAGNLSVVGSASLGSEEHPAATRVYVGGTNEIQLTGGNAFVANLYAPEAPVAAVGSTDIFGSVFAKEFSATGRASIRYDRAILSAGDDCDIVPPEVCLACGDCSGGTTCVEGSCVGCRTDADCCEPQVCDVNTGRCGSLLF
ncbi:MAG: hypothetical protein AAGF12_26500 [Myxococcota bacterium]